MFLLLAAAAAASGSAFPPGDWYAALEKPSWTPPSWLFPPVWTALYAMMALAGWRLWRARGLGAAMIAWGIQLGLNAAWPWLFFGLHRPELAFFEIRALWIAIAVTMALAWRVDRPAVWLLAPYLAWVGFASALNYELWQLNP